MPTDNHVSWWRRLLATLTNRIRRQTRSADVAIEDHKLVLGLSKKRIPSGAQLRYLPQLFGTAERRWIRLSITLATISAIFLIGHALWQHFSRVPTTGGTLTEGVIGAPQFLNPVLARPLSADQEVTGLLFRGLLKVDEQLHVVPDLAESVDVSTDGKVYTVKLRQNIRWSNGDPLTVDDVRYTYETVADSSYQSPVQSQYKNVSVSIADDRTVVFTLASAYEPFRSALTLGILPAKAWQDQSPQTFALAELNVKPITNGPYKFQSLTKDRGGNIKAFTFIRNKEASSDQPFIEKVIIKVYPDMTSALDALNSNAIDSLGGIDAGNLEKVAKHRVITRFGLSQLTAVFFSQKTNPALKVKEVRQALAMAVDRPSLIAQAFGALGRPADGPLVAGQPGYAADVKRFGLDITQANTLLDQAGWKRGDNGVRAKGTQILAFTLTTVDDPTYAAVAHQLAEQWKALGANVDVKTVAADRIQKDVIRPRQYDALLFGQIMDTDADPYAFWHSSQQHDAGFALAVAFIKKVDQDLEAAQKATTTEAHDAALKDFQSVIGDEVPAIILAQSEYAYAHLPSLRGITATSIVSPADRFDNIERWYVTTGLDWK